MFKVRPQNNVVLESCLGCFQIPIRVGGKCRCAIGRESINKLMLITGKAAILAAREYAFYPFGSSTLTSAATMESPSPIAIGLANCASNCSSSSSRLCRFHTQMRLWCGRNLKHGLLGRVPRTVIRTRCRFFVAPFTFGGH